MSLVGTWVAHLISGSSQKGTWQVGSTWSGVEHPNPGVAGLSTVAITLAGLIETPAGLVSGSVNWPGEDHQVGPFTGTVHGSVMKLTWTDHDITAGGTYVVYFKGKVSAALGGMSGTWNSPAVGDSPAVAGVFQLTRSGASAAI